MKVAVIVLGLFAVSTVQALSCWECDNVYSHEECREKGRLRKCDANEDACLIEMNVRDWGFGVRFTKRCKASDACMNNQDQNSRNAWAPSQCNLKPPSSVCRCCCFTDQCNREGLRCWDQERKCEPVHTAPKYGFVSCSDGNAVDSVCTFTCGDGHVMVGKPTSTCLASAQWDQQAPVCKPITCPPPHVAPVGGKVRCSNKNYVNSMCTFSCNQGYTLEGVRISSCNDDFDGDAEGFWATPAPTCNEIRCAEAQTAPANGRVQCSDGVNVGSVCDFRCNYGYALVGNMYSKCLDENGIGLWQNPAPTCREIMCKPRHTELANGQVTCSDDNNLDSVCAFVCNMGFSMMGAPQTTCVDDGNEDAFGEWSSPPPTCEPIKCTPGHIAPSKGAVTCSRGRYYASICVFTCEEGYNMEGSERSICRGSPDGGVQGQWSENAPLCRHKMCPPGPGTPMNGRTDCTQDIYLGSECEFTCNEHHNRVGEQYSTCVENEDGSITWDRPVPVCEPIVCDSQRTLPHGEVSCTNYDFVTSTCEFECTSADYELYPPEHSSNQCLESAEWNITKPCCARPCPPYAIMDFVVVLDSSSSVGAENWVKVKSFVHSFLLKFTVSPEASYYGIFRYNREVDTGTQILLSDFPNNKDDLLEAFENIPYDGSGTNTGNAIDHVTDVMLLPENGNRPGARDIVLVITDGRSQDGVKAAGRRLRDTGAMVYVLPINPPRGSLDMDQVRDIAGDESNIITDAIERGFDALDLDFSDRVVGIICGNPCDHVLHDHEG